MTDPDDYSDIYVCTEADAIGMLHGLMQNTVGMGRDSGLDEAAILLVIGSAVADILIDVTESKSDLDAQVALFSRLVANAVRDKLEAKASSIN